MRRLALATCAAVVAALAGMRTAPAEGPANLSEMASTGCGTWTQERRQYGAQPSIDGEWVLGFVSGVNWSRASTPASRGSTLGAGIDGESWIAFVDNYCISHPLDTVAAAAIHLIQELERRAEQ
jgi:hypothetical protein